MMVNVIKRKVKVLWSHGGELTRCIVLPMQAAQSAHLSSSSFLVFFIIIIISIIYIISPVQVALSAKLTNVLFFCSLRSSHIPTNICQNCPSQRMHVCRACHICSAPLKLIIFAATLNLARIVLLPPWVGLEGDPSSEGVPYKRCSTNADV